MTLRPEDDLNTLPPSQDPEPDQGQRPPPTRFWDVLRNLGPGLIIAGSIVGSGELIATTKTGAQAGIALLWLVIIGCVIKVFVQIELGRYTISRGESTLAAMDSVPGPRFVVNWLVWYWLLMMLASMGQLGGIVGGVGQSLAIAFPITGDYVEAIRSPSTSELKRYVLWDDDAKNGGAKLAALPADQQKRIQEGHRIVGAALADLGPRGPELLQRIRDGESITDPTTRDDQIYATLIAIVTAFMLYWGRYDLIQNFSTVLVVAFTFITLGNVIALQTTENWSIPAADIWYGLSFHLPSRESGVDPIVTALATFGIIGVGATELIAYPYWCLEKGYARYTGQNDGTAAWLVRAKGWIRVMHIDAFASLVIYTVATLAFFLMGVAVLYNEGRDPDGMRMVSTLSTAYVPIFGEYARWLFLGGAFAVLYSTFLVASAGHSRTVLDALKLCGVVDRHREDVHRKMLDAISFAFPLLCLGLLFAVGENPVTLILWSGIMQALMLPMLAGAALYFRYTKTDPRLRGAWWWDALLLLSSLGMLLAGGWVLYTKLGDLLARLS